MNTSKASSKSVGAGLLVAFTASLCCITPVLALVSGVGGMAASFSWMEPFRPYLIVLTIGVLGFAWYQKLKPRTAEEIECDCEEDDLSAGKAGKPSFWQSRKFLGIVTVFAGLMLAFPSYSYIFYPEAKVQAAGEFATVKIADFNIEGMTCTGCEEHVKFAASQLDGVLEVKSSYESGTAQIKFEASNVTIDELTEAINATGYTVVKSEISDVNDDSALE